MDSSINKNCPGFNDNKKAIYLFANKIYSVIWLHGKFKPDKETSKNFKVLLSLMDDKTISSYFSDDVGNAILISKNFLSTYVRTFIDFKVSQETFSDNIKFICLRWIENRSNIFLQIIDCAAIIAEICKYCDEFGTYKFKISDAVKFFTKWFNENCASEFFKLGSWEQLKYHSSELCNYWSQIFNNSCTSRCEIVNRMRNSPVMYPLPEDYFCKKCRLPTDTKFFRNIVYVSDDMNSPNSKFSNNGRFSVKHQFKCEIKSTRDSYEDNLNNILFDNIANFAKKLEKPQSSQNPVASSPIFNKPDTREKTLSSLLDNCKEQNVTENVMPNDTLGVDHSKKNISDKGNILSGDLMENVMPNDTLGVDHTKKNLSDKSNIPSGDLIENSSNEKHYPKNISEAFYKKEILTGYLKENIFSAIFPDKYSETKSSNIKKSLYDHSITVYFSLINCSAENINDSTNKFNANSEEICFFQTDTEDVVNEKFQQLCKIGTQQDEEKCIFHFASGVSFQQRNTLWCNKRLEESIESHLFCACLPATYSFSSKFSLANISFFRFKKFPCYFISKIANDISVLENVDLIFSPASNKQSIMPSELQENTACKVQPTSTKQMNKIIDSEDLSPEQEDSKTELESLHSEHANSETESDTLTLAIDALQNLVCIKTK